MDYARKQMLINLVRSHECLYEPTHSKYKNNPYKTQLWEKIGAAIGTTAPKAKNIWRSIRDGYIRYKKTIKEPNPNGSRRYSNFTWSEQMTFLDDTLERAASAEKTSTMLDFDPELAMSIMGQSPQSPGDDSQCSPLSEVKVETEPTELDTPSSPELELKVEVTPTMPLPMPIPIVHDFGCLTTSSEILPMPPLTPLVKTPMLSATKRRNDSIDDTEKCLDVIKNKRMKEWDSVDYLFMSYASTFKKLSMRNQAKIKVALATLFVEAELNEFESSTTETRLPQMPTMYWSQSGPGENSLGPLLIKGDPSQSTLYKEESNSPSSKETS